jgi:hypothetical protein
MSSNIRNLTLSVVFLLVGITAAHAQPPLGARASGMAGAFVGVADDASAVYWNPAGIATGTILSAIVTFGQDEVIPDFPQSTPAQRHRAWMAGFSLPPVGLAYYQLAAFGSGPVEPAGTEASDREEVRRSVKALTTSVIGVSLLHSLSQYVVVGVTPKWMRGSAAMGVSSALDVRDALDAAADLDGHSTSTFDVDVGVMLAVSHIRLGVVARNLTTPEFDLDPATGEVVELDTEVRIGGAWGSSWPGVSRLVVAVDGDVTSRPTPSGDRRDIAAGVETWWFGQRLGLRGGARRSTIGDGRAAFAAGVSAAVRSGTFVEAHVMEGREDQRGWSIGMRFGF